MAGAEAGDRRRTAQMPLLTQAPSAPLELVKIEEVHHLSADHTVAIAATVTHGVQQS
jgi:hypothetical protein